MGQATAGLYALLGSRCRGLKIHEWKNGILNSRSAPSNYSGFLHHGSYLVCENPSVSELWGAFYSSLTMRQPLVLLPPSSSMEREVLLRQLPTNPPSSSVLVLFTSGSTGDPKAVFHSEKSLLASAKQLATAFPGMNPTLCLLAPWGMAGVAFHCLLPAARGGSDVLFSAEPLLNWSGEALRICRELEVELLTLNPFLLEMLLRSGLDESFPGKVVSLTAPLKQTQREKFAAAQEIFGLTEAAGPVLLNEKSLGAETRLAANGELEIRGEQLFLGYASNGVFLAHSRENWFPTGDIFENSVNGFRHQGRTRELIDLGGRKVPPLLVEAAFEGMPELAESFAFAKILAGVERPALVFVRAANCHLTKEELGRLVDLRSREKLSPELRPSWILEIEKVPRLKNGKPDRAALKQFS